MHHHILPHKSALAFLAAGTLFLIAPTANATTALKVVVNSNADTIERDQVITLREAIALTNGQLNYEKLTRSEKAQITRPIMVNLGDRYKGQIRSKITFNLPSQQKQIRLGAILPPLLRDGTVIDASNSANQAAEPQISLQPMPQVKLVRGLHIQANGVMVKGLSLKGFGDFGLQTYREPAGDIVIGQWETNDEPEKVVQDIVITDSWLGKVPPPASPALASPIMAQSGFGVYVFNAKNVDIRNNQITQQRGSGIITGKRAIDLKIHRNQIHQNGLQGMADGIRLEGNVRNAQISNNTIDANSGSGIYLFKPQGNVTISQNQIRNTATKRAAVYLMGDRHIVRDNQISSAGSGIIITAYPRSRYNQITGNRFRSDNGLSIDLVSQRHVAVNDYFNGDGRNLPSANYPSTWDFANRGIDAPKFVSREFIIGLDGRVEILGTAQPGSTIELYLTQTTKNGLDVISQPLQQVQTDRNGRFKISVGTLKPSEKISATASHPEYGTSEAGRSSQIRAID